MSHPKFENSTHLFFYYMIQSHALSSGRKTQVQKEKCYRRGLPFTINLLQIY